MKKRTHRKKWNAKTNKHDMAIIRTRLNEKQFDLKRKKPLTWRQKFLEKLRKAAALFREKYGNNKATANE